MHEGARDGEALLGLLELGVELVGVALGEAEGLAVLGPTVLGTLVAGEPEGAREGAELGWAVG